MIKLIGKTLRVSPQDWPEEEQSELHLYWIIQFPASQELLGIILDSGAGCSTIDDFLIVSGNIRDWHTIAKQLLKDPNKVVRKFGTLLVQTIPEPFKNLSRTLNSDGTIAVRA